MALGILILGFNQEKTGCVAESGASCACAGRGGCGATEGLDEGRRSRGLRLVGNRHRTQAGASSTIGSCCGTTAGCICVLSDGRVEGGGVSRLNGGVRSDPCNSHVAVGVLAGPGRCAGVGRVVLAIPGGLPFRLGTPAVAVVRVVADSPLGIS